MKKLEGKLTITSPYGGSTDDGERVNIRLTDELSGTIVCEIRMSHEHFAQCLLGLGYVSCSFEMISHVIGKKREVKYQWVPAPEKGFTYKNNIREIPPDTFLPYEVDGWKVSRKEDYGNHHCQRNKDGKDGYLVGFVRFVDAEK